MSKGKGDKLPRYEEALAELDTIIEKIESGAAGLEESLKDYERGVRLIAHCRGVLDAAEKRIAELVADPKSGLRVAEPSLMEDDDSADTAASADEGADA